MTLATLNLLAFAWHSVFDHLEPPWKAAREAVGKRTAFFAEMLVLTKLVVFPSFEVLLQTIVTSDIPPELLQNRKIE
jgi:hypothetical protein